MELTPDTIFEAALALTEGDRLELAHRLLDTLPPEPDLLSLGDPNMMEELDRRSADDSGAIPWSQLKNQYWRPQQLEMAEAVRATYLAGRIPKHFNAQPAVQK